MVEKLTDKTWEQIKNDRISVVKVSTSWCGPCKMLKPRYIRWEKMFKVYNGEEIRYYEVDGDKCHEFKQKYKIDRYPTTLFFVYGVMIFKQLGMSRESVHEDLLKKTLEIKYKRGNNGT